MIIMITQWSWDYSAASEQDVIIEKSENYNNAVIIDSKVYNIKELETAIVALNNI